MEMHSFIPFKTMKSCTDHQSSDQVSSFHVNFFVKKEESFVSAISPLILLELYLILLGLLGCYLVISL